MSTTQSDAQSPPIPTKKRTLGDNLRQLRFNLTAVRGDLKYLFRVVLRELRYFIPLGDLLILFSMIILIVLVILGSIVLVFPFILSILINPAFGEEFQSGLFTWWDDNFDFRIVASIIGVVTIVVRLMVQSPINKYQDKVNARKDVTYIFGSSKPAEQFLFEMVHRYGYEERVSLIADSDLLWIRKLKAFIDVYVVEDMKEFEKPNLYDIIGFKNATRVMILTESVELNQNILTNMRQVRPDVEIILLSQYAPNFVFSDLVKDENLILIEDLDVTVQGLVLSLSLDFDFPQTSEIDVPRTYVGKTGDTMSFDIPKLEVILIRRGDNLLPSTEKMSPDDRIVVYYYSNFDMKRTNRVVTELPHKKKKRMKEKKEKKPESSITGDRKEESSEPSAGDQSEVNQIEEEEI
ncbi:MAG: hypothetical protein ACW98F_05230 [Candidatus Hodarchaeales archaeon]|jgi:hypothetical protein